MSYNQVRFLNGRSNRLLQHHLFLEHGTPHAALKAFDKAFYAQFLVPAQEEAACRLSRRSCLLGFEVGEVFFQILNEIVLDDIINDLFSFLLEACLVRPIVEH